MFKQKRFEPSPVAIVLPVVLFCTSFQDSHRLSTTRLADRIYMLENGRIIEEGSHNELLERKGKYAQMWKAQAGQYC